MNKILSVFIVLSVFLSSSVAFADFLVGKVDVQRVLLTVNEGKKLKEELTKDYNEKKASLTADEQKILEFKDNFRKQSMVLSEDVKHEKEKELQKMIAELQNKSKQYQEEIQNLENKHKKTLIEKIKKVILDVSTEKNVDFTFEILTSPIYAKKQIDLTEDVIKAYDAKYPD